MRRFNTVFAITATILLYATSSHAEPIDFVRDVRPILEKHCYSCHGVDEQQSGLRLDIKSKAFAGGDGFGPTILAGNSKKSPLVQFVDGTDDEMTMPPEGDPLSKADVSMLTKWVDDGAVWPEDADLFKLNDPSDHWSFKPVVAVDPPETPNKVWPRNGVDHFVLARLEQENLHPATNADRVTWLRRVYFTLTGLPPSPEQVDAFVQNQNENAYQEVVEELLESPRYGERWAQHWLDVIRWSETVGFETNLPRPNAWHYRDWVIAAFNQDKPYDEFLRAQLAGDTTGEDAALGFLVAGPANLSGQVGRDEAAMREARQDELDEVIRTVSQSLFGLTIGCARCHGHKFDPITQSDYYAMQALFAGLSYGDRRLRGTENDAWTAQAPAVRQRLTKLQSELESLREEHGLRSPLVSVQTETFPAVLATAVRMEIRNTASRGSASLYEFEVWSATEEGKTSTNVALAAAGAKPDASSFLLANQTRHFTNLIDGSVDRRQAFPWVAAQSGPASIRIELSEPRMISKVVWHSGSSTPVDYKIEVLSPGSQAWITVADTGDRLPRIDDIRSADQVELVGLSKEQVQKLLNTTRSIRETQRELRRLSSGPQVYAARFVSQPDPTWLLGRGDAMRRVSLIAPAVPAIFGDENLAIDAPDEDRRLALARHLTRADHPLTARVMVNRVWQHHFGTGLVDTPSDFGNMGMAPSHPELLDWLALELVNNGWSLKHLHRLIVLSRTYQQSSQARPDALRVDAQSRLLWRFPPRRLEAEAIRDSILTVSGKLNIKMGGPGFDFFNQRGGLSDYKAKETFDQSGWRRMIYAHKIRMQAVDIFGAFDCPDAGQMKPKRSRSITPIQSLSLLNSPFVNRQANFFADRIRNEVGEEPADQVRRAFELTFSRAPSDQELSHMVDLASDHGLQQVCRVLFNTKEFIYIR